MVSPQDAVVMVVGGAGNIGSAIVKSFLKNGAKKVYVIDSDKEEWISVEKEISNISNKENYEFHELDITNSDELHKTYDQIFNANYVDLLINCAGYYDESNWKLQIKVNLESLIDSCYKYIDRNRKDKHGNGGTIINIGSLVSFTTELSLPVYTATKHAVLGFSRCYGNETVTKYTGIRVITVCPGMTGYMKNSERKFTHNEKFYMENLQENGQTSEFLSNKLVEIYKIGDSASVWVIDDGKVARLEKYLEDPETNEL